MSTAKKALFFLFIASCFIASSARAENPYQFIAGNAPIGFGAGGAASVPGAVLAAVKGGQLSPVIQFILVNNMMTQCVKKVVQEVPGRRDPFVVANKKFQKGYCKIKKCFEQGMLMSMLSQLSSNPAYGGSSDQAERHGSQLMLMALSQAFNKEESCTSGSAPIDPGLVAAIGN